MPSFERLPFPFLRRETDRQTPPLLHLRCLQAAAVLCDLAGRQDGGGLGEGGRQGVRGAVQRVGRAQGHLADERSAARSVLRRRQRDSQRRQRVHREHFRRQLCLRCQRNNAGFG